MPIAFLLLRTSLTGLAPDAPGAALLLGFGFGLELPGWRFRRTIYRRQRCQAPNLPSRSTTLVYRLMATGYSGAAIHPRGPGAAAAIMLIIYLQLFGPDL